MITPAIGAAGDRRGLHPRLPEALVLFGAPTILAIRRASTCIPQIWAFFHYPPQVEVASLRMPYLVRSCCSGRNAV
jgi:hypothetical protein